MSWIFLFNCQWPVLCLTCLFKDSAGDAGKTSHASREVNTDALIVLNKDLIIII